jgi:hypothetical protein
MKIEAFQRCFHSLCDSFDLDYDKKKGRVASYYDSKLGELREEVLLELIKKVRETMDIKPGFLPPIKKIVNLYFSTMVTKNKPRTLENSENWEGAICPDCNSIGLISEDRSEGRFIVGCCKCIIGQKKQHETKLGRKLGCYEKDELPREAPF